MNSYRIAPHGKYRIVFPSHEESGLDCEWMDFDSLTDAVEAARHANLPVYDDKGDAVHPVVAASGSAPQRS